MAWNRPSEAPKVAPEKSPSKMRGVVAGLVVVALAAACVVMFMGKGEEPVEKSTKERGRIKAVTPAAAPKAKPTKPKDPPGYYNGKPISDANRPPWMNPYHRIVDYGPIHTNKFNDAERPLEVRVFHNSADIQIAQLLLTEPGASFIGGVGDFYDEFDETFRESLKTPIVIDPDDTEEVRELKLAVKEVREDLKQKMQAGENLRKLMEDTWTELKELGLYKEELQNQVEDICADNDFSEKEVNELVAAANTMLKERGCSDMKVPSFVKARLRMKAARGGAKGKDSKQSR